MFTFLRDYNFQCILCNILHCNEFWIAYFFIQFCSFIFSNIQCIFLNLLCIVTHFSLNLIIFSNCQCVFLDLFIVYAKCLYCIINANNIGCCSKKLMFFILFYASHHISYIFLFFQWKQTSTYT